MISGFGRSRAKVAILFFLTFPTHPPLVPGRASLAGSGYNCR